MVQAVVLQPNGKLAVWSSVVDRFIYTNQTEDQVVSFFRTDMSVDKARDKVKRGVDDETIWPGEKREGPFHRWKECLKSIVLRHELPALQHFLADCGNSGIITPEQVDEYTTIGREWAAIIESER